MRMLQKMLYTLPPKRHLPSIRQSTLLQDQPADLAMAEALVLVQENYEHPNHWMWRISLWDLRIQQTRNTEEMQRQLGDWVQWFRRTITNIVTAKDHQGKGWQQRLWQNGPYDFETKRCESCLLEVREQQAYLLTFIRKFWLKPSSIREETITVIQ